MEDNSKDRFVLKKALVILAILCLVVVLILSLVFLVTFFSRKNPKLEGISSESEKIYEYNYLRIYPKEKTTSFGILRVDEEISATKNDGFVTYENPNDYITLISKMGNEDYHCTGRCYCENNGERRIAGASRVLSRGLIYLLSAFSSVIVMKEAKEYFDYKCQEMYSEEECPSHYLKSEVEDCTLGKIGESSQEMYDQCGNALVFDNPETGPGGHKARNFICNGNCQGISYLTEEHELKEIDDFHCQSKFFTNEFVQVECPGLEDRFLSCVRLAKQKFVELLVSPMCESMSLRQIGKFQKTSLCEADEDGIHCSEVGWDNDFEMPLKRPLYGRAKCKYSDIESF